ncbi:MAG: RNB domain-containing ribonuclease [Corynebacterium sp.]|nr:RNB domain-containing ribonuclease [Corynebacterium sp.]
MKLYAAQLDFHAILTEFQLHPEFSSEVLADADAATDRYASERIGATDINLVTIDPPGSMDLDQAVCIEAGDGQYIVHYAIADVAAFIIPGSALHAESLRRGQSIYLPDQTIRLHPPQLSEGKASLLPDQTRPAILWTITLDSHGQWADYRISRALVRSRARFTYEETQAAHEAGTLHPAIAALPEVGQLLQTSAVRADAITLNFPSQAVQQTPTGLFELIIEPRLPMMGYNSEISLLAGRCAGTTMAEAGVGILRTLADLEPHTITQFWTEAEHLGFTEHPESIGEFLRILNANTPRGMAIMREAQKLLRGAEYLNLADTTPQVHAGVIHNNGTAKPEYYSHVTAPLRRLIDRYATEIVLSLQAGSDIPDWVTQDLPTVLNTMTSSSRLAGTVGAACLDYCEAEVLKTYVGQQFPAITVQTNPRHHTTRVFVDNPPVFAECDGALTEGERHTITLTEADPARRAVRFSAG